ncbi:hypothetical protein M9Y10_021700 [Tritrichomonas musculus]|uniref:Uncharacterized protein n=1 Tax=Tritrichomonas musculus TaxID=1915356 RepID=A0ABR2KR27_9EUKA
MLALFLGLASSSLKLINEERGFLNWMRSNNQYFVGDEYNLRLGLYLARSRYIQEFNKRKGNTFKVGFNKFSCYTPVEYQSLLGFRMDKNAIKQGGENKKSSIKAPDSLDWRDKGVVNAIKDQGQCGSCWAFSAVSTCESAYAIKTGTLLSYSEQNLVDCVTLSFGCNGGNPSIAISYITGSQNGQFNSEEDYPYKAVGGTCSYDSSKAIGKVTSYHLVSFQSETDLQSKLVSYGPVSVAIDASQTSFNAYAGGIYQDSSCSSYFLDHAVCCVGYGSEDGTDYWIVRNSWGTAWGEQGYFRLLRGQNMCGIASSALVAYI